MGWSKKRKRKKKKNSARTVLTKSKTKVLANITANITDLSTSRTQDSIHPGLRVAKLSSVFFFFSETNVMLQKQIKHHKSLAREYTPKIATVTNAMRFITKSPWDSGSEREQHTTITHHQKKQASTKKKKKKKKSVTKRPTH